MKRISRAQHLRDTETSETFAFNQVALFGSIHYGMFFQPTFAFVAPVGPADNQLLRGQEFMNARVKEVASIRVDWNALAATVGAYLPVVVTRYILATNDTFPAVFPNPPTVAAYAFLPSATANRWFSNFSSNQQRWVVNSDNVTLVQKKRWRISPPGRNNDDIVGNVSTVVVKGNKFFKGKKEFEDTSGISGVDGHIELKGWNFYTVWIYSFEADVTLSGDSEFITVTVDNYTYFKDP